MWPGWGWAVVVLVVAAAGVGSGQPRYAINNDRYATGSDIVNLKVRPQDRPMCSSRPFK